MVQTDYIIRIIEQFAAYLWAIVFNKKAQNYDIAFEKIEEVYNGLLHLDPKIIKILTVDEIIDKSTYNNVLDKENIEIIASLFFEEADILERINGTNPQSFHFYQKSIELFLILYKEMEERQTIEYINQIISKLENYEIENSVTYKIYEYYMKNGLFGKAEDKLYQLMDSNYPNIKDKIKVFYKTLLDKEDNHLKKGNLPRNEIISGIMELEDTKSKTSV
jgi:hypothetical protein